MFKQKENINFNISENASVIKYANVICNKFEEKLSIYCAEFGGEEVHIIAESESRARDILGQFLPHFLNFSYIDISLKKTNNNNVANKNGDIFNINSGTHNNFNIKPGVWCVELYNKHKQKIRIKYYYGENKIVESYDRGY